MLPVRNRLVNPTVQNVSVENKETAQEFNHLEVIGVKEVKPFVPNESESDKAVIDAEHALKLVEQGAFRKSKEKKTQNSNTKLFLEELNTLIESWAPQSLSWEGDRRPILYDFECRDLIRKLISNHGL